ncbi:MAG: DUF4339 domain-containing protein, partial [Archangium sp.]
MDGNQTVIEGDSISRAGSGALPPRPSAPPSSEASPGSVQSALREVRPDDLDAIFDGALFGPPALEEATGESAAEPETATPVPVGAMDWYVERDGQSMGPLRLERLRELWHQGVLDPDTLFWCEAWSHWRPLSRVPELVAAMTISGLPTVAADASVSPAPARAKGTGSEKKVVSTLHSLVAEEEGWLRKREEDQEQAEEEARSVLLDAPEAPEPVVPEPVVPMAPPVVPVMMAAPALPEAPAPWQGKTLLAGVLIGSAAASLIVGALLLLPQVRRSSEQGLEAPPRVVENAPKQVSAPAVPPPAPVAAPVTPPPAPVVQAAQPEKPKPAAVAEAAPVAHEKEGAGRRVAAFRPEASSSASEEHIARAAESAMQRRPQSPPAPVAPPKTDGHKALQDDKASDDPSNFDDSLDKDFEKELGFAKDSPKHKPEDPRSKRTVYLPPEPSQELPESLSTSDVVQVVSAHKDA